MKKLFFLSIGILLSCTEKSTIPLYQLTKSGSVNFSASDGTYDSSVISVSNGVFALKPLYQTIYNFNDNLDGGWSSQITGLGGSFATGPDFSLGTISFASQTNWVGLTNLASSLTDYVTVSEFSASVLDGASTLSSCLRAQANLDDHYLLSLASGTLDISVRTGGITTSLGTAALALTPVTGTTYMMKASAIGTTLGFRVWESGTTEPTSDQISFTDATFASGSPCVMVQAGVTGAFDNIRVGDSAYTTDYSTAAPSITFPAVPLRAGLGRVAASVAASGSDSVRFEVSLDGGATFLIWDGFSWITNTAGFNGANVLSTFSERISELPMPSENLALTNVIIKAYLHSQLGYTTPQLSSLTIVYK